MNFIHSLLALRTFHGHAPRKEASVQGCATGHIGRVDWWVDSSIKVELSEYLGGLRRRASLTGRT